MIQFPLVKRVPTLNDLKRYLYQAIHSDLGLADQLSKVMDQEHGGHDAVTIGGLSDVEIRRVLQEPGLVGDLLPEIIHEFVTDTEGVEGPSLLGIAAGNGTPLYTGIMGISFDEGGLVVMQSFCSQVYSLHDTSGNSLVGYCHDLELGVDGQVLMRPSDPNGMWAWMVLEVGMLRQRDLSGTVLTIDDFPSIHGRDMVPPMLDAPAEIHSYYPSVMIEQREDVITALLQDANAFRVLRDHYCADEDLAIHAVRSNNLAFSLLSEELRNDEPFLRRLAGAVPGLDLHYLLVNRPGDRRLVEYTPDVGTNDQVSDLPF